MSFFVLGNQSQYVHILSYMHELPTWTHWATNLWNRDWMHSPHSWLFPNKGTHVSSIGIFKCLKYEIFCTVIQILLTFMYFLENNCYIVTLTSRFLCFLLVFNKKRRLRGSSNRRWSVDRERLLKYPLGKLIYFVGQKWLEMRQVHSLWWQHVFVIFVHGKSKILQQQTVACSLALSLARSIGRV